MHDHAHHHHDHHGHAHSGGNSLLWGVALTLGFALFEALGGWWAQSLALLGDAGHMVSDATALGLAALAAHIAKRPPSLRHSYGLGRAEVVAALINSVFMVTVVVFIIDAAITRLRQPVPVAGGAVMAIALVGLFINILVAWVLSRGERSLNNRAALLHVLGDALASVAALISGVVIYYTGWLPADPLLSLLICALILYSAARLLREVLHIIMEGVPSYLNLREVGLAMAGVEGVNSVHDLHIWTLSSGRVVLSAHVNISSMEHWDGILARLQQMIDERFAIDHVTLQPQSQAGTVVRVPAPPD
ncbi:MAG: cation diffusion facilitator family transporter [Pseudomonadota bacterium]